MSKPNECAIVGADFAEFCRAMTKAMQESSAEVRAQLKEIRRNSFAAFGFEGTFERLNGKTPAQMIAEYKPIDSHLVAKGQIDDIRFQLYDAPPRPNEAM